MERHDALDDDIRRSATLCRACLVKLDRTARIACNTAANHPSTAAGRGCRGSALARCSVSHPCHGSSPAACATRISSDRRGGTEDAYGCGMSVIRSRRGVRWVLNMSGFAAAIACSSGCAPAIAVHAAAEPSASFAHYRTFSFGPIEPVEGSSLRYGLSPASAARQRLIWPIVTSALLQKGYIPAAGVGDLTIRVGSGRRVVTVRETATAAGEVETPGGDYSEVEKSVVIDAFDATSGARVWHGSSGVEIGGDGTSAALLERVVTALFVSFPPCTDGRPVAPVARADEGARR